MSATIVDDSPVAVKDCDQGTSDDTNECLSTDMPEETKGQEARYVEKLGPLRVDFVDDFRSKHTYASSSNSGKVDMLSLAKELQDFDENLPVHAKSTVFVRALEARLDLVRVLITGKFFLNGCRLTFS